MQRVGVHRVLVMEGDALVGIVSSLDLVKAVAARKVPGRTLVFGRPARPL